MSLRVGIDVGGTFTDFVLSDSSSGKLAYHKQPSTPDDPSRAIAAGVGPLLAAAQVRADQVDRVVHGTTMSLNAILLRRFARVALVVSPGNRDILEIARVRMSDPYGFFAMPEEPLARRDRVFEFPARLGADGSVVATPSEADYRQLQARIVAAQADAVAVVLLNACANPAFEQEVAVALRGRLAIPVAASTEVWPEIREYERAVVAVMNAGIGPLMYRYYGQLAERLNSQGLACPLTITTSNGGSVDLATAHARPIDSILSGPASGVVAAISVAREAGVERIVTFDMGGTSADIALAEGDAPEITTQVMLGEIPVILPVVNVNAIGAGGGSIIRVDDSGFLKVGPGSAGAVPGPACFDRGGDEPTITDCYLLCGFVTADGFAGGSMRLSIERAERALEGIARALGLQGTDATVRAAEAALRVASSMMGTEVRKTLARRGCDPADFTLLAYGGGGATHAALLANEAALEHILVPVRPGVLCALGASLADLRRDFVRSCRLAFASDVPDETQVARLAAVLRELRMEGDAWMAGVTGTGDRVRRYSLSADMRYRDQAFDLSVTLPDASLEGDVTRALLERFHADHLRLYGFNEPAAPIEMSRVSLSLIAPTERTDSPGPAGRDRSGPLAVARRPLFFAGRWHDGAVVQRSELVAGDAVEGPAVVEQTDTSVVVPPLWRATWLASGSLSMRRCAPEGAPA
ncbi:hydantoinase/oxoprolinase family protein [Stenotrophomonas sp. MMGLT7]|uniref:hydantoinase/oxoprolinase family protein n=1 Tax=Stenotrophomonas sp. MMGLT7 TaxID=2901227 RepID=UPI001E61C985|nr:hydantoinase/oxoprolinase family protein [Stenotrophomonas sp. MMGLT7]MCD7098789.1 hydantoinase/oxoprolinase family protein [Stenotrophomonas sp. MMGLT7]